MLEGVRPRGSIRAPPSSVTEIMIVTIAATVIVTLRRSPMASSDMTNCVRMKRSPRRQWE